eukprot:15451167-Alexandrium_andersonii.AAC.1
MPARDSGRATDRGGAEGHSEAAPGRRAKHSAQSNRDAARRMVRPSPPPFTRLRDGYRLLRGGAWRAAILTRPQS